MNKECHVLLLEFDEPVGIKNMEQNTTELERLNEALIIHGWVYEELPLVDASHGETRLADRRPFLDDSELRRWLDELKNYNRLRNAEVHVYTEFRPGPIPGTTDDYRITLKNTDEVMFSDYWEMMRALLWMYDPLVPVFHFTAKKKGNPNYFRGTDYLIADFSDEKLRQVEELVKTNNQDASKNCTRNARKQ